MKLYWKNKQMEEVDVLSDSVLKAHITFDQEAAIIVDRDNKDSFLMLAETIADVNGEKKSFTVTFSH